MYHKADALSCDVGHVRLPSVAHVDLVSANIGRTADGAELRVRSPWYRSLPLSCIDVELAVDDAPVDPGRITFCVNGNAYSMEELTELIDEFWFVLDPARLRVTDIAPGAHDVAVRLGLRIPYLFDEETGDVLQLWSESALAVTVPEEASA